MNHEKLDELRRGVCIEVNRVKTLIDTDVQNERNAFEDIRHMATESPRPLLIGYIQNLPYSF